MDAHSRPLLTTIQAAELLQLRPQTLRVWRGKGKGPRYVRIGHGLRGRVLYRREDVQEWMAGRTFASTADESARLAER